MRPIPPRHQYETTIDYCTELEEWSREVSEFLKNPIYSHYQRSQDELKCSKKVLDRVNMLYMEMDTSNLDCASLRKENQELKISLDLIIAEIDRNLTSVQYFLRIIKKAKQLINKE